MAFLDGLTVGRTYLFRTPWGAEWVELVSIDTDSLMARDMISGANRVYRPDVILSYEYSPAQAEKPAPAASQPDTEPQEARSADIMPEPEQPAPAPEPEPSYIFEPDPEVTPAREEPPRRHIGVIDTFFASPQVAGGFGYIQPERAGQRSRKDGIFFHIRQVSENNLYQLLTGLPVQQPDDSGKRRPSRLTSPVTVSYLLGDNRARTDDARPVAYDIRLSDESRAALISQSERRLSACADIDGAEYIFSGNAVGYFSEYNTDAFDQLALRLYVMDEDSNRELTLLGRDIANPYLKRYLEETRPAAPAEMAFSIDLFERVTPAKGRRKRKTTLVGAHAMLISASPWSADDEKRWEPTLTSEEREVYRLCREPDFTRDQLVVALPTDRPIPVEETLQYDDGSAQAPYYAPLEPWLSATRT